MSGRIAEIIKKAGLLSKEDLAKALEFSQRDSKPLAYFILANNMCDEEELMKALAEGLGQPEVFYPHEIDIEPAVINCVPKEIAYQYRMIPVNRLANNLIVAVGDPTNIPVFDAIQTRLGVRLKLKLASELSIQKALDKHYATRVDEVRKSQSTNLKSLEEGGRAENYVINFIDRLLQSAAQRKASDIHIEPFETHMRVRLRVDGSLLEYELKPRFEAKDALLSRVKIISQLDIAEKRFPQDGNAKLEIPGYGKMDFRVSSMPTVWGEKIVLRLLDKGNLQLDMTRLGFDKEQLDQFKDAISKPFGMVLVTGPTGSGKTTTLYSALNELNRTSDCVVTAEDPVEFTIPGIAQVNVRLDIGFNFAKALKAFLRQDPDVIMVGEVRDAETAEIAMKAALTGHIVLSTLHTNNASETIERLRNLGVASFTIISALNAVVAQRLVRKICVNCKQEVNIPAEEQISLGMPAKYAGTFKIYKGEGCDMCNGTGYKGRCAIYEVLTLNDAVKRAVAENASVLEIKRIAMASGMQTLRQSAWKKVYKGMTTIDELLEASNADTEEKKPTQSLPRSA
jgi:type IV pilus assembly protein PilB